MPDDPFDTAAVRRAALVAWSASAARLREDANAEEALVLGGYAGRVLVELAANAVDAARAAGVPARLRIRLAGAELRVANTGAPLTAEGLAALASLRASAKRDDLGSIGRFGVGFTAVLAWTEAPRVVSTSGGIRFDRRETAAEIAGLGRAELDRELAQRGGHAPALRLPWPVGDDEPPPPAGYDTEVRLPLLDPDAVRSELVDPETVQDLVWAVPELTEIDVAGTGIPSFVTTHTVDLDGIHLVDDGTAARRYRTAHRTGQLAPELLAGRPVEERDRRNWWITWARELRPDAEADFSAGWPNGAAGGTVGAPTPTDEPISLPARLVGTFPVDDTRRRLAPGPLADHLLDRAAACYLDLMAATPPADRWRLLPTAGFPRGPIDATLRAGVLDGFAATPLLVSAAGDELTAADAVLLPGLSEAGAALVGQAVPGLLPPASGPAETALRAVGVRILTPAAASTALAGIDRPAEFWRALYAELAVMDRPPDPEDLADLPVPLVGGRRAFGARGCLLPVAADGGPDASSGPEVVAAARAAAVVPGLRIVDAAAAHPLLLRLGAVPADPSAVLGDPAVAEAIRDLHRELDDADPDPDAVRDLGEAVLDLIAVGGRADPDLLGLLVLTDDADRPWPAGELRLPDARIAGVLAADADLPVVGPEWSDRYSRDVLGAAGVRGGFRVVTVTDPDDPDVALPDLDEWLEGAGAAGPVGEFAAIADLDLIDEARWPEAIALLAADRDARAVLAAARPAGGPPAYPTWWLGRHAVVAGRRLSDWRSPGADELAGVYDPLPIPVDERIAAGLGVRTGLADAARDDPQGLLERVSDPARDIPAARVPAIIAALTDAADAAGATELDLPAGVRTLAGTVVDAELAAVLDGPWLLAVLPPDRLAPGGADPRRVADLLDLPLASQSTDFSLTATEIGGTDLDTDVAAATSALAAAAGAVGRAGRHVGVQLVARLTVAVDGGAPATVGWWVEGDRVLATADPAAIGRAVAWSAGIWSARHRCIAAAAGDLERLAEEGVG